MVDLGKLSIGISLMPVVFLAFCGCLPLKRSGAHSPLNTCPQEFWVCTNNTIITEIQEA